MTFRQFLADNVNNRAINASGGAGINPGGAVSPQKGGVSPQKKLTGGAFGGGNDDLKDVPPSSFNPTSKDSPADLKKFNGRPPSSFSGLDVSAPGFKPPAGPHLPGVLAPKKNTDPTKLKGDIPLPKIPEWLIPSTTNILIEN